MTVGDTRSRVLVVGLDGATFDVLTPFAASGLMPNLARLLASSALAVANSTRPYITPVAWTTFQTGTDPGAHGIFDYRYLDHTQRRVQLNQANRIATPTLWDAIQQDGGEVVSLNLPMTYPPPAHLRGIMVGGLDSPSIEAALAPYPRLAEQLKRSGARYSLDPIWRRRPGSIEELTALARATREDFWGRVTAAHLADKATDWRMMFVQFQTLDSFQHRAWHLLGLDDVAQAPNAWVRTARGVLADLDYCLGELAELAARRQATLVVVSDHGFGPFREKISVPEVLARRDLLRLPGRGAAVGYHLARAAWRLKKGIWRRWRPGRSTAQLSRPWGALLPIDWRRSVALTLHGSLGGLVYLNSPRRFGCGPVDTPRVRDQALADVSAAFHEATHPDTGESLFKSVLIPERDFDLDPVERMCPDLVAIPCPGFHTRHKFDRTRRLMRPDPALSATHRAEGVLLIHSPQATLGQTSQVELRDVAPTLLHLLGISAPPSMMGRVLHEMFTAPRVAATHRHISAPHYVEALAQVRYGARDADADELAVESRLRDLGYVE